MSLKVQVDCTLTSSGLRASIRKVSTNWRISWLARAIRLTCAVERVSSDGLANSSSQEVASTISGVRNSWLTSLVKSFSRLKVARRRPSV